MSPQLAAGALKWLRSICSEVIAEYIEKSKETTDREKLTHYLSEALGAIANRQF
jgi:hypothetical protein